MTDKNINEFYKNISIYVDMQRETTIKKLVNGELR